jgi:transcriptional regulator GlxA family with amidase domain
VEVAAHLLATTELEMKEIAAQVGFRSLRDMERVFRLHQGCPPCEYRQQIRGPQLPPAE